MNGARRSSQGLKFSRLVYITVYQDEKLCFLPVFIAAQVSVAGEQRQNILGPGLLADAGHAEKAAQRSGDDDEVCRGCPPRSGGFALCNERGGRLRQTRGIGRIDTQGEETDDCRSKPIKRRPYHEYLPVLLEIRDAQTPFMSKEVRNPLEDRKSTTTLIKSLLSSGFQFCRTKHLFFSVDPESIPFSRIGPIVAYLSGARTLLLFRADFQSRIRPLSTALRDVVL